MPAARRRRSPYPARSSASRCRSPTPSRTRWRCSTAAVGPDRARRAVQRLSACAAGTCRTSPSASNAAGLPRRHAARGRLARDRPAERREHELLKGRTGRETLEDAETRADGRRRHLSPPAAATMPTMATTSAGCHHYKTVQGVRGQGRVHRKLLPAGNFDKAEGTAREGRAASRRSPHARPSSAPAAAGAQTDTGSVWLPPSPASCSARRSATYRSRSSTSRSTTAIRPAVPAVAVAVAATATATTAPGTVPAPIRPNASRLRRASTPTCCAVRPVRRSLLSRARPRSRGGGFGARQLRFQLVVGLRRMKRFPVAPRRRLAADGRRLRLPLPPCTANPTGTRSACYAFTLRRSRRDLEGPSAELAMMCLDVVDIAVRDEAILHRLGIPAGQHDFVHDAWRRGEALAVRALRLRLRRPRPGPALRVQRRHADRAVRNRVFLGLAQQALARRLIPPAATSSTACRRC